ncbi:MAG TPA: cyclopropane-fatty-acyl-phospholipid synthase family protein [Burkholderiales bacterium]|nr:cyclopropane-fatty-acyl-phospholipid synthase family protein [Burkholderiales bacterium]
MNGAARLAIGWVEQGLVPDSVVRAGIRRLCEQRLRDIRAGDAAAAARVTEDFVRAMDAADTALVPELANAQHYEVPAEFFGLALGAHRKYSSCWWPEGIASLDDAEAAALATTCRRAGLAPGQDVLELGCGWGSLTLWMAARFPTSRITAVSNSSSQRQYIQGEAARRGLRNVEVLTADMNRFDTDKRFDRVVSVEMFEHMRNWRRLFGRVHGWLRPEGRFFMHVFCHRSTPYAFVEDGPSDWMSRHFFSGGMMPSDELALRFQEALRLVQRWRWDGTHYEKTANAWLANLDARREQALPVLAATYGEADAAQWLQRWRIFFMACAELFGYRDGQEWWVSHYLFERTAR